MSPSYPYAVYLDSKIHGAGFQLSTYFRTGVFDPDRTIIYLKKYKRSFGVFRRLFSAQGLTFQCMKSSDLDRLEDQTVFYLFNAQSNCRLVANRRLKHVFVTHGESNKVSSIKPITRIYDHVAMAGYLSLQRYYRSGHFEPHDYGAKRLIMTGDTFIGRTGLAQKAGRRVLFYAPTWEGGVPIENYSSLGSPRVLSVLRHFAGLAGVSDVLIKPHPNLGHRLGMYTEHLLSLAYGLRREGFKVFLHRNNIRLSVLQRMRLAATGVESADRLEAFQAAHALIDVSAMETQCVNERIPYHVLSSNMESLERYTAPEHWRLYRQIAVRMDGSDSVLPDSLGGGVAEDFRSRLISYSDPAWRDQSPGQRLRGFLEYVAA
ncbi:hypothetical protein [Castellaniella denitrificans]|uniref:hypothetical protein n=1 Tax=Castellaniella denitrificans TaxID=56119 RepID=UPI00361A20CF